MSTINMQLDEPLTDLYIYMDFNSKRILPFYNNEKRLKLNIEKLAKKRLQIKNFWQEVQDVRFVISKDKETLEIHYDLYK